MRLKKILFICGSLEPGRDGVGDYAREVAGAINSRGIEARIISIKDRSVAGVLKEKQWSGEQDISVLRLSESLPFKIRKNEYEKFVSEFNPQWISLQYVPYAFSSKGIPLQLYRFLKIKTGVKWHFMIHESYIGNNGKLKRSIVRRLQILTLNTLVKNFNPLVIHTTIPSYQSLLRDIGIESEILGLFGNIPITENFSNDNNDEIFRGVYFGAPPKEENFEFFINGINQYLHKRDDSMELVLCGQSGKLGKVFATALRAGIKSQRFDLIEKGRMAADDLSNLFLKMDFGIARISPHLLGKSGSAIAMLEHGLPLWIPLAKSQDEIHESFDFRLDQCFFDLSELQLSKQSFQPGSRIEDIVNSFINGLIQNDDIAV